MESLAHIVDALCQVFLWAIFIRVILSWFPVRPDNPAVGFLNFITEPVLAPLRRIIPRTGVFDFAPMVAMLILILISRSIYFLPS